MEKGREQYTKHSHAITTSKEVVSSYCTIVQDRDLTALQIPMHYVILPNYVLRKLCTSGYYKYGTVVTVSKTSGSYKLECRHTRQRDT